MIVFKDKGKILTNLEVWNNDKYFKWASSKSLNSRRWTMKKKKWSMVESIRELNRDSAKESDIITYIIEMEEQVMM